jgi:hypothetical protein
MPAVSRKLSPCSAPTTAKYGHWCFPSSGSSKVKKPACFVLTGGGPNYATTTVPLLAYLVAIPGTRLGAGAAISMTMVPIYLILVFFLTRRMLHQGE